MELPTASVSGIPDPLPAGLLVLDVREEDEWRAGHVEGSMHVPLMELGARLQEVPVGRTLVVCQVGGRSAQAVAYLNQHGHEAFNLHGGMIDWADAGRLMVSDTGQPPHVV